VGWHDVAQVLAPVVDLTRERHGMAWPVSSGHARQVCYRIVRIPDPDK
jgi:hypothetical protein